MIDSEFKNGSKHFQHIDNQYLFVTPSGFEPKSSEPESEILSIELWGQWIVKGAKVTIFWDI